MSFYIWSLDLADHEWHTQSLMLTADQCPFIWLMGGTWIEAVRRSAASVPTWFTGVWDWPQEGDSSCGTPSPLSGIHRFCCPGASPNCIHVGPQWNTLSYWSAAIFMSRLVLSFQVKHLYVFLWFCESWLTLCRRLYLLVFYTKRGKFLCFIHASWHHTCRVCVHFQETIIRGADGVMSLDFLWQETEWPPLLFGNAGVTGVSGSGSRGFWKFGLAWVGFLTGFLCLHFQHPVSLSCNYVTPRFK
jgi:hypothetical protein